MCWWNFYDARVCLSYRYSPRILVALVNAIAVAHHEHGLYSTIIPIEAVIVLVCLSFIGPGKYSVDKG